MIRPDWQPRGLQNENVKLTPLQESDFEALYKLASDPLVWEQHPNPDRYQRPIFMNYFEGAMKSCGAFLISKSNGEAIGCTRFYEYDFFKKEVLIGYTFVGRKFWGSGLNQEVKQLMLSHAFQYVDTVHFHIGATNYRSQQAILRTGAIKTGEIEIAYYGEDSKTNYIYSIKKENYIF